MTRRPRTAALLLAASTLLLSTCSSSGTGSAPPSPTKPTGTTASVPEGRPEPQVGAIDWTSCRGAYECADLEVPVDWSEPEGDTLTVAVLRRPATGDRIGALFFNPGGPGGSAIDLVTQLPLAAEITERFDIVGFDPRGVGASSPLTCDTHLIDIYSADPTIEDEADREAYLEASQAYVDECAEAYGDLLPFLGTESVARDLDAIRAAMGDDQVSYVGYSYGTSIGQTYARLFPERVRAMVLDGVVDLSLTGLEAARGQAAGFTTALDAYLAHCEANGCGFDLPADEVIDEVVAAAEAEPIPAPRADRPAGPGEVSLALAQALYSRILWGSLSSALADGLDGDGSGLVQLADQYLRVDASGSSSGGFEIYFSVSCLDQDFPRDPDTIFDAAKDAAEEFPRFGEEILNDYVRCALWPVPADPIGPVPAELEGLAPILVVSTTNDPATPYENGVAAAEQIPGAVLLTNVGEGHTIYGGGKSCIDDAVNRYLIDLTLPTDGLRCE